jgi:hypothetical protein
MPVFQRQSRNPAELISIGCHQDHGKSQGLTGKEEIVRPNRLPLRLQKSANSACLFCTCRFEGHFSNRLQQGFNLGSLLRRIGALLHAGEQLITRDGGDPAIAGKHGRHPLGDFWVTPHHGNACVGVEKVSRHSRRASIKGRHRRSWPLTGPLKRRIVNSNGVEKVFRPMSRSYRLQDNGIALSADRHDRGCETEFLRQRYCLTIVCLNDFDGFHKFARRQGPGIRGYCTTNRSTFRRRAEGGEAKQAQDRGYLFR